MKRVMIAEEQGILADALEILFSNAGCAVSVVRPGLGRDYLLMSVQRMGADVVLLGLDRDDDEEMLDAIVSITSLGCKVIALLDTTNPVTWVSCLHRGAVGLFSRTGHVKELIAVVDDALAGRPILSRHVGEALLAAARKQRAKERASLAPFTQLTVREQEVVQGLVEGFTAQEIATDLGVRLTTVRSHIRAALRKLGVRSQLAAVAMARRAGWPHEHAPTAEVMSHESWSAILDRRTGRQPARIAAEVRLARPTPARVARDIGA